METFLTSIAVILIAIVLLVFYALITGLIVWLAWNAVMPYLFDLPKIDIIQGFALSLLGNSLFRASNTTTK